MFGGDLRRHHEGLAVWRPLLYPSVITPGPGSECEGWDGFGGDSTLRALRTRLTTEPGTALDIRDARSPQRRRLLSVIIASSGQKRLKQMKWS